MTTLLKYIRFFLLTVPLWYVLTQHVEGYYGWGLLISFLLIPRKEESKAEDGVIDERVY